MTNYKKWTPQERTKSLNLTNKAKRLGLLMPGDCCERCNQKEGIIQWHNENYDVTLDILGKAFTEEKRKTLTQDEIDKCQAVLFTWCWRCHMMFHSYKRNPKSVEAYFHRIDVLGEQDAPVIKHNFNKLKEDYNV